VRGQALVGKVGMVTEKVRGGELPGEVRLVVQGLPHHYLAYCTEPIAIGVQVLVINFRGSRQIDVEPWQPPGSDLGIAQQTEGP
jgi:hypothetical protein